MKSGIILLFALFSFSLLFAELEEKIQYDLQIVPKMIRTKVGIEQNANVAIQILVQDGYIHDRAPLKIETKGEGVEVLTPSLSRKDAASSGSVEKARNLSFPIRFKTLKKGKLQLHSQAEFFLCTQKVCLKKIAETESKIDSD